MRLFYVLVALVASSAKIVHGQNWTCGNDTFVDVSSKVCRCSDVPLVQAEAPDKIYLAGIYDVTTYDWSPDIFELTVKLINGGWWEDVLIGDQHLEYSLLSSKCDQTEAARAYWNVRTQNGNQAPDGIVGARCSGPSTTLARISGLEGVPMISPASNAATLSDAAEFPYFSRLVSPNNERGEVGALIATLRQFGWARVTILATETTFSSNFVTEFKKSWNGVHEDWTGKVASFDTIRLLPNGSVDEDSVLQALDNVPTGDPKVNSRIILLAAHSQHAFKILEVAQAHNFQPDSIWVGPSTWVGRSANTSFAWLPEHPGYIGVAPFRNRDDQYDAFLKELQDYELLLGKEVTTELPPFAAETVDAIVAMAKALSHVPDRRDGKMVVNELRRLGFAGVSGQVQFTSEGDRKDPKYSIFHAPSHGGGDDDISWTVIGHSGTAVGSATLTTKVQGICFPVVGCGLETSPKDSYPIPPIPPAPFPWWMIAPVLVFALAFAYITFRYIRSKRKKLRIKEKLETFRNSVVGMAAAECEYIPKIAKISESTAFGDVEEAITSPTVTWCWEETHTCMSQHDPNDIAGDPTACFIKYDTLSNGMLEAAFQQKDATASPLPGYVVDFGNMVQTKTKTGFTRSVKRLATFVADDATEVDFGKVHVGESLPETLAEEPQMVLVGGDIMQISLQRPDGWAFGHKLYHADREIAKKLITVATGTPDGIIEVETSDGTNKEKTTVSMESGWFHTDTTRVPTLEDLKNIQKSMGDAGALDPPSNWKSMADPSIVEQHNIPQGDPEHDAVARAFLSSLQQLSFGKKMQVLKVARIQNLAMWQSFVVKRQAIYYRETGENATLDSGVENNDLQLYERRWLWHGSNKGVMDKILQQGFNRSFCGKNATAYGKGVYFARNASYSACTTYSQPDSNGNQYMMACRVAVGEYCRGLHNAVTPDVRDSKIHLLFDSTVDKQSDPSIYVTYHDAQAYPEYLITFKAT